MVSPGLCGRAALDSSVDLGQDTGSDTRWWFGGWSRPGAQAGMGVLGGSAVGQAVSSARSWLQICGDFELYPQQQHDLERKKERKESESLGRSVRGSALRTLPS